MTDQASSPGGRSDQTSTVPDSSSGTTPRRVHTLLAIYVPRDTATLPAPTDLEAHARTRLPEFMLPHRYEAVAALPLTASGKLDRTTLTAALAAREGAARA